MEEHPQPHPEGLPGDMAVLRAALPLLHGHAGDLQGVQPGRCPASHGVQAAAAGPQHHLEGSVLPAAVGDDVALMAAPEGRQQLQDGLPAQPGHGHAQLQGTLRVQAAPAHLKEGRVVRAGERNNQDN